MAAMLPASVYGLRVPAGGMPIPAAIDFPATIRITMAAIDPTASPQLESDDTPLRATLKLIREPMDDDDDDDSDDEDFDDIDAIKARLAGVISDDEDMSDDEDDSENEKNGGPSDPAKTKQARKEALSKALQEAIEAEEMELDNAPNGVNGKGKAKATDNDESDSDEEDFEGEMEEFVLCTLDPSKNYQQPLEITVGEHERVYFSSNGTHDIYLTGNYVLPVDDHDHDHDEEEDYDSEEMDYDLEPDSDEIISEDEEDEDDELDGLQDPRITELPDTDDEEAPKLVKAEKKSKKRAAEDSDEAEGQTLDELINKSIKPEETNGETKLSKKQAKKLKKNDGKAAAAAPQEAAAKKDQKETNGDKKDKKVQFAKNLELGPTGSPKVDDKKEAPKATGPRVVNSVTIDDKKLGKGPGAKKGDKIEMRYIGKLKNGKQFDANKKGKPFSFKVGSGEVVKGMDIGVMGMAVGGERRITIPAKLGYGNRAMGSDIPANSELIFDIKCLGLH